MAETSTLERTTRETLHKEDLPPLGKDIAFYGMTATQFFGAFNDNLIKQLVLFLALVPAVGLQPGRDLQPVAMFFFAIQFVLFSGFAGYLADRFTKRTNIILAKYAELLIVILGAIAFWFNSLPAVIVVLSLMGIQSAFFGPSKYGILPEMVRDRDLPPANGVIQMTTFLAIIFGTAAAGLLADWFPGQFWKGSIACIVIAIVGIVTSHLVRKTPIAQPNLPFSRRSLIISADAWKTVTGDRPLLHTLLIYSLFWFIAGIVQPAVNALGEKQMQWDKTSTALLVASLGFGIAIGCASAGILSKGKVNFQLVSVGAWGMAGGFVAFSAVPHLVLGVAMMKTLSFVILIYLGFMAGLFAVPLQVFLQVRPPAGKKGQVIGAMNLFTWIGVILSAVFYEIVNNQILVPLNQPVSHLFAIIAICLLPIAIFFRPPSTELE